MSAMSNTFPDIPDFLRIPQVERRAAWVGRKLTRQGARFGKLDAAEERERKRLQREYDREQERKKKERFAAFLESKRHG